MKGGLDRQVPPVLKQERERLIDRKEVLEANINRITKEFQSLGEDLFDEKMKTLQAYEFELRMDEYLGWVYDKHKGFRSKSGRSQDLRQWLNSTKARKWADSLFGDMFDSCRQYAREVGHALENNLEGIEYLTNYLQCEFFIATMTGTIGTGSGSGSRPLICDHSFHKRNSKMLNILNEGVYSNSMQKFKQKRKSKTKKEGGTTAKKYFVELYKKWSDRYFALYIMYKTKRKNGIMTSEPLQSIPPDKNETVKMEPMDTKMDTEMDTEMDIERERVDDKTEMELELMDSKYGNWKSEEEEEYEDNDDEAAEDSSSDSPLIKIESFGVKEVVEKEQGEEEENNEEPDKSIWQKLSRDNKEMKDNIDQMKNKIHQLRSYRDLELSSLRKQLKVSKQRSSDAESKNVEYEERIKSINEEMTSTKHAQQSLISELGMLRGRLEMMQNQSNNNHGTLNQNGNMFGYNGNIPQNWMHLNVPALQMPHFSHSSQQLSAMSSLSPFPNVFGFPGNDPSNAANLHLPLLNGDTSHSSLVNNVMNNNIMNGDGTYEIDTMTDLGLKRANNGLGPRMNFDWSNGGEDFNAFPNSPFHSTGNMELDLDNMI